MRGVAEFLKAFPRPWFIAGGWAVDLFLGRVTRPHADVDVALFRRDAGVLRAFLRDWEVRKVVPGDPPGPGRLKAWREGDDLERPVHEVHASRRMGQPKEIELLLEESQGDRWVYRRDPAVGRGIPSIGLRSPSGISFLAPEIVLLYKAKAPGARDDEDFRALAGRLGPEARQWLADALARSHPASPWRNAV